MLATDRKLNFPGSIATAGYDVEVLEDVGVATAELRRGLVCTPHSLELQRATAAAVMDTIVTPLTDRGVDGNLIDIVGRWANGQQQRMPRRMRQRYYETDCEIFLKVTSS